MKLYYVDQRKVFPFLQPVEVCDEQGNVRYRLKSKCTVGLQLHLLTPYDEEVASIRQKVSLGSEYIANVNGKELTVTRKATFFERGKIFSDQCAQLESRGLFGIPHISDHSRRSADRTGSNG